MNRISRRKRSATFFPFGLVSCAGLRPRRSLHIRQPSHWNPIGPTSVRHKLRTRCICATPRPQIQFILRVDFVELSAKFIIELCCAFHAFAHVPPRNMPDMIRLPGLQPVSNVSTARIYVCSNSISWLTQKHLFANWRIITNFNWVIKLRVFLVLLWIGSQHQFDMQVYAYVYVCVCVQYK